MFMALLISTVDTSNLKKCALLRNHKCMTQSTFINLYPNEYSHEFHYYPFTCKLDRCVGNCNLNDLSNKECVPNKTKHLNLGVFHINELKTLTKHISWKWKCEFSRKKCNSNQWWNTDKYL